MKPSVLNRYRVMAYFTGVMLLLLCIAMVIKYGFGGSPALVTVTGMIHGFGFIVYLLFAFDLGTKAKWPIGKLLLVLVAGTVPFCSFIAERKVVHEITPTLVAPERTPVGV